MQQRDASSELAAIPGYLRAPAALSPAPEDSTLLC